MKYLFVMLCESVVLLVQVLCDNEVLQYELWPLSFSDLYYSKTYGQR